MAGLRRSIKVSGNATFRTPEQEVLKLLEECAELRQTLKSMSAQLSRMEARVKHAFPAVSERALVRKTDGSHLSAPISAEQALAEFDRVVKLATSGAHDEAERILQEKPASDLLAIAKEVGVSFPTSKPSIRTMREAIFGKVRESILLTRHNPRTP
jgi:hypothetical protein